MNFRKPGQPRATGMLVFLVALFAPMPMAVALFDETRVTTIFAFDDVSIPFTENLRLKMRKPVKHPANPLIRRGSAAAADSWAVQFYGSVIRVENMFRLWYVAVGDERLDRSLPRSVPWRVAYAESADGINWTKPNLGLVERKGNKNNNLVHFDIAPIGILNVKVLHEPEAVPAERYKMAAHAWFAKGVEQDRFGTLAVFVSPDGLNWSSATAAQPVNAELSRADVLLPWTHYEPVGGFFKWDGLYYTSGQNAFAAVKPYHGRVVRSFVSADFRNWEQASAVGYVRTAQHELLGAGRSREGEQAHEGVSVWNRGNVLLGTYGLWHGGVEWAEVTIDLGFVVSNDGIIFREPAHDWPFIERGPDSAWDQGGILQAQGFENVGDKTFVYYGAWDPRAPNLPRGGVGLVTLPRDRFGDLVIETSAIGSGDYQVPELTGSLVTAAIPLRSRAAQRFYLNVDGLGPEAALKVELLDARLQPLPGAAGSAAAVVRQNGFQTPVLWNGLSDIAELPERIRVRLTYDGPRQADIRFSALYIQDTQSEAP